jgi:hypothetical protein
MEKDNYSIIHAEKRTKGEKFFSQFAIEQENRAEQCSAEQCRAVQSSAEQCRAVQSSAEQCRAVQSSAEQSRREHFSAVERAPRRALGRTIHKGHTTLSSHYIGLPSHVFCPLLHFESTEL